MRNSLKDWGVIRMGERYTCKDCKYYRPIDDTKGECFGHTVPADMPAEKCPAKAFELREKKG